MPAPIVCAVDDRYVGPLCVLMQSLATAHGDAASDLRLVLMHRGLSDDGRGRVGRHAARLRLRVELREVPGSADPYPVSHWVTDAVYIRLGMGEIGLDSRVVLYLDADAIVLRDLRPLMETDLDGRPLAAVPDEQNPVLEGGRALPGWPDLGLPPTREYFNSGVMLIDLPECERRGLFAECRRFLGDMPQHVRFWDQDALNWAVRDDWLRLDRRWNTVPLWTPEQQDVADEPDAAILHFAGPNKPWNFTYPHGNVRDLYQSFARLVADAESD